MKKNLMFLLSIVFLLPCMILFSSCGTNINYNVNFIVDGEIYATIKSSGNETITMPDNPNKDKYLFEGWYWDKDIWKKPFTAKSLLDTPLSSNMSVYARFINDNSLKGTNINIEGFETLNNATIGDYLYLNVPNIKQTFSFADVVEISNDAKWILSTDIEGVNSIPSKTVQLSIGDNIYYITVTDKDENVKSHTVIVRRKPIYDVYYNLNNGTNQIHKSFEEGAIVQKLDNPTKTGYTFTSWSYDFNLPIMQNITINAIYTPNTYTITFDANSGEIDKTTENVVYDMQVILPIPTKQGYTFGGWFNNSSLVKNGLWKIDNNVTLIAKWNIINYKIYYNLNGGKVTNPLKYTIETNTFTLNQPTKQGYIFNGWTYEGQTKPIKNVSITKGSIGNKQYIANWTAAEYNITYNANGGNVDKLNSLITYDSYVTLPISLREGYTFIGWFNETLLIQNGQWKIAQDVELIAHWKANLDTKYIVNYYQENSDNDNYTLFETITNCGTTDTKVSPELKEYDGFTTPELQTKNINADGSTIIDYYYVRNKYNVTYISNNGQPNVTIQEKFGANLKEPKRTGYTFGGWFEDINQTIAAPLTTPLNDIKIFAWWKEESKAGNFKYLKNETVSIVEYVGQDKNVIIPEYIDKMVTTINKKAIYLQGIINIKIPKNIKKIGEFAFNCMWLDIGSLENWCNIDFEGPSTSIETHLKVNNSIIKDLNIPDSVINIKSNAFSYCKDIISVTMSNNVKSIGNGVFQDCSNLKSLTLSNNLETIGNFAFDNCNLTSLIIPKSVLSLGEQSFYGCKNLNNIKIFSMDQWYNIDCKENVGFQNYNLYLQNELVQNITIPSNLTQLRKYLFSGCISLKSVIIQGNITNINESAFTNCINLTNITLSNGIKNIEKYAFSGCISLTTILLPQSIIKIGDSCLQCCENLLNINFDGSSKLWGQINKGMNWALSINTKFVYCISDNINVAI